MSEKKTPPREVSPYDPSAIGRVVKVTSSETGMPRRGDAYDLSQTASRAGSGLQKAKG